MVLLVLNVLINAVVALVTADGAGRSPNRDHASSGGPLQLQISIPLEPGQLQLQPDDLQVLLSHLLPSQAADGGHGVSVRPSSGYGAPPRQTADRPRPDGQGWTADTRGRPSPNNGLDSRYHTPIREVTRLRDGESSYGAPSGGRTRLSSVDATSLGDNRRPASDYSPAGTTRPSVQSLRSPSDVFITSAGQLRSPSAHFQASVSSLRQPKAFSSSSQRRPATSSYSDLSAEVGTSSVSGQTFSDSSPVRQTTPRTQYGAPPVTTYRPRFNIGSNTASTAGRGYDATTVGSLRSQDYDTIVGDLSAHDYDTNTRGQRNQDHGTIVGDISAHDYDTNTRGLRSQDYGTIVGDLSAHDYDTNTRGLRNQDHSTIVGDFTAHDYDTNTRGLRSQDHGTIVGDLSAHDYDTNTRGLRDQDYDDYDDSFSNGIHDHEGLDWLRDVVPGVPGLDYPTLAGVPDTLFSCGGRQQGYYADVDTRCQVYHVCHGQFRRSSFLCPNGTVFSQSLATCDWWFNTECTEGQPLPSSTFREGRLLSGYMFEDDWIDDYEDDDVTSYRPSSSSARPQRPSSSYGAPSSSQSLSSAAAPVRTYQTPPPRTSPSRGSASRPSARPLPPQQLYRAPAEGATATNSADSWTSFPERTAARSRPAASWRSQQTAVTSRGRSMNYSPPGGSSSRSGARPQSETFLATLRAPVDRGQTRKPVKTKPFIIRVRYGGRSADRRDAKDVVRLGPAAVQEFLSRAKLRRWSFVDDNSVERRLENSNEPVSGRAATSSTARRGRALQRARDKPFDYEIGRRQYRQLPGQGSRELARPGSQAAASRTILVRQLSAAPVAPPDGPAPKARSRSRTGPALASQIANSMARGIGAVQDGYDRNNPFAAQRAASHEIARENGDVRRGRGGRNMNYSFSGQTPGGVDDSSGRSAESTDLDYNSLLSDDSFRTFGLKIPKQLIERRESRSQSAAAGGGQFSRPFKALSRLAARAEDWNPRDFSPWAESEGM